MLDSEGGDGLLTIFLAEAEEIVERLVVQVSELQYGYDSQRILDNIHRSFHTLYGGARVMEMESIAELSLSGADVIQQMRGRRAVLSPALLNLIDAVVSSLTEMFACAQRGDALPVVDSELSRRLQQALEQPRYHVHTPTDSIPSFASSSQQKTGGLHHKPTTAAPEAKVDILSHNAEAQSLPDLTTDAAKSWWQDGGDSRNDDSRVVQNKAAAAMVDQRVVEELHYFSRELCWVRDLLLKLEDGGSREERRRAMAYLDLLANDVAQWSQRKNQV
jgi:chemotaxis protein histidine kinase CheA